MWLTVFVHSFDRHDLSYPCHPTRVRLGVEARPRPDDVRLDGRTQNLKEQRLGTVCLAQQVFDTCLTASWLVAGDDLGRPTDHGMMMNSLRFLAKVVVTGHKQLQLI
jgi:hypothetical protein